MKALFITTHTNDVANHVGAWASIADEPPAIEVFDYQGIQNCWRFEEWAKAHKPDVIFYIGAWSGRGNPKHASLRKLRDYAPTINMVSDACDKVWHPVIEAYRKDECFDLQVSIDGPSDSPCDLHGVTPVAAPWFEPPVEKMIALGYSGNVGQGADPRAAAVMPLKEAGLLAFRLRDPVVAPVKGAPEDIATWRRQVCLPSYLQHIDFMKRCKAIVSTSFTGSAERHHVKGRVPEAGFARCALFETAESPAHGMVPKGALIPYHYKDSVAAVRRTSRAQIEDAASLLAEHARAHWRPEQVYGAMLDAAKVPHGLR